jgi:hypothetical protein
MAATEVTAQDAIDALRLAFAARQTSIVQTVEAVLDRAPATDPNRQAGPLLELLTEIRDQEAAGRVV